MEVREALDRIGQIHDHLARTEVYRGYRPVPVAASGALGIVAALLQPACSADAAGARAFIQYWVLAGAAAALVGAFEMIINYVFRETPQGRRGTRRAVGQFLPSIAAAVAITWTFFLLSKPDTATASVPLLLALLPGLWAILFGLGIFASRPYLPRAVGWIALAYVLAGIQLLALARGGASLSPWAVGGVFGIGQCAAAAILYWNLERKNP